MTSARSCAFQDTPLVTPSCMRLNDRVRLHFGSLSAFLDTQLGVLVSFHLDSLHRNCIYIAFWFIPTGLAFGCPRKVR